MLDGVSRLIAPALTASSLIAKNSRRTKDPGTVADGGDQLPLRVHFTHELVGFGVPADVVMRAASGNGPAKLRFAYLSAPRRLLSAFIVERAKLPLCWM